MKRIGGWFSFALMADILYCLPGTTQDVVERSGISQWRAVHLMRQLHALKLVHKARFEYRGLRRSPMTVWARGNQPDAVAITKSGAPRKPHAMTKTQPLSAQVIAFASLMRALQEPQTVASLIEETGVSPRTAGRFVKHLRETGRVYIASWERSRRRPSTEPTHCQKPIHFGSRTLAFRSSSRATAIGLGRSWTT